MKDNQYQSSPPPGSAQPGNPPEGFTGPQQPGHPFYGYPPAYGQPGQMPEGAAVPPPGAFPGYGYPPPVHAMPGYYPPPPPYYYPGYYPPVYPQPAGQPLAWPHGAAPAAGQPAAAEPANAPDDSAGLAGLGKLLDFEDKDFWKGALLGAAAVFILTNDSVQEAMLKGGARARDKMKSGMDSMRDKIHKATDESDTPPEADE